MGGMSGGGGGGMGSGGMGGLITAGVSSIANVGAGWFADKQLAKGTNESMQRQNEANDLYRSNYATTQAEYAPYMKYGSPAMDALARTFGIGEGQNGVADFSGFQNSPDYKWALEQGQKSLDNSAASKGMLYSGAQMKASQNYGQGQATQFLGNYRNGLNGIATTGLNATNALSQYRMGYGNQLGNGITSLGDLAMARRLGRANINYKNVAAQDSIWGGQFGSSGVAANGNSGGGGGGSNALNFGGGSNYGGGASSYSSGYSFNPSGNVNSTTYNWGG